MRTDKVRERQSSRCLQKTILIADDDPAILAMVTKLLTDSHYYVLSSTNSAEVLQQSRSYKQDIHLLLSDFEMPEMSGIELATAISIDRPQMKILLMSGLDRGMLALKDKWHFVAKPFIPSQLRTLIGRIISPDPDHLISHCKCLTS